MSTPIGHGSLDQAPFEQHFESDSLCDDETPPGCCHDGALTFARRPEGVSAPRIGMPPTHCGDWRIVQFLNYPKHTLKTSPAAEPCAPLRLVSSTTCVGYISCVVGMCRGLRGTLM